jgi:hypothetical protein
MGVWTSIRRAYWQLFLRVTTQRASALTNRVPLCRSKLPRFSGNAELSKCLARVKHEVAFGIMLAHSTAIGSRPAHRRLNTR